MTLEQRITRLEAIEAIKCLKASYFEACDRKQPDLVRACFAPGAIDLRYGRIGAFDDREQMIEVFTELACSDHIIEMHHGQNPRIEILDDTHATAHWGLYYYMIDTRRQTTTQLAGFYDDAYQCLDGHWLITRSHYEVASTQILDLSDQHVASIFAGGVAPATLDDPNEQVDPAAGEQ